MSATGARAGAVALAIAMLLSAVAAGAIVAPVVADEQDDDFDEPASYYGSVTIDGEPAPAGTEIAAVIDGERRGSIVVEEAGEYGGPTFADEALVARGDGDDEGEPVTFLVNGVPVETDPSTVEWESGDLQQVDLAGEDVPIPDFRVTIDEDETTTAIQPGDTASVVAEIENVGDAAELPVTFELDGEELDERTVSLGEGESRDVTFAVTLEAEGEYEATVASPHDADAVTITVDEDAEPAPGLPPAPPAPPEPDPSVPFAIVDTSLSDDEIPVGGVVVASATVENQGESAGIWEGELTVDGAVVAEQDVAIGAGATETVSFTRTFDAAGEYALAIGGEPVGTVAVGTADVQVTDADVSDDAVAPGDEVEVTATVENDGDRDGEATIELTIDGEVVDSRTVSVAAGATETVTFVHTFDEEGEYAVAVNGVAAGTVTVAEGDDDGIPGFGAAAAIVALLLAIGAARRRA